MKIKFAELPKRVRRLNQGETYTRIAEEYGVTPWAIQKKVRNYKVGKCISLPTLKSLRQRKWREKKKKEKEKSG